MKWFRKLFQRGHGRHVAVAVVFDGQAPNGQALDGQAKGEGKERQEP